MSFHDAPPISPPWPVGGKWDEERDCTRCGETVQAGWRHFMRPCVCTYTPRDRAPHAPDPGCPACDGCGFLPCEKQDLSVMRMSGACAACGAWSSVLVGGSGVIGGSGRHYDDTADHDVLVVAAPLARTTGETLTRYRRSIEGDPS